MKLNRTDGIGPSRRPELDQDDQPPTQRQRHEAPSANETNMLNLSPAPRRASSGQGRDSTALHVHVQTSGPALSAEPHTAVHARMYAPAPSGMSSLAGERPSVPSATVEFQPSPRPLMNAVAPLPASLIGEFRNLPRRGPGQSLSMYADQLLRHNAELTLRLAHGLACRRLSNRFSSDADHRRVNQMFAAANAEPRRQNESYRAYQQRRRVTVIRGTARLLGTTTRALMEDLASTIDRNFEGNANTQHVASTLSNAHANTSDTAVPASRLALPVAPQSATGTQTHPGQLDASQTSVRSSRADAPTSGPSTQPLASSEGVPSNQARARQNQSAALAGPSGTAELQTGAPPRTHALAPLPAPLIDEFRHLPPQGPNEPDEWYAHRLYEAHGWRFVPLLYQFANDRLPNNEARVQMALGRARLPNRQQRQRSAADAYERRRDMLGIGVAADLLHTTTNALMLDLASRIAESHPNRRSLSVAQRPYAALAIDRAITRDALDMLTGMHDEQDMRAQAHPHTLAVIDHLGDIGSLPEDALHSQVLQAVRDANNAAQLVMNLRDMVTSHPNVLPARQRAQQHDAR